MRKLQARWYTNIVLLRIQCPVTMMIQRPTIIIYIRDQPMLSQSAAKTTSLQIMFGGLMVTYVFAMCAVLAAGASFWRRLPWGPCSVTCGQTPGAQSRRWEWRCRTGVNGVCRISNRDQTRRCESHISCVTPKPASCRCTTPHYTEPCCPRGETIAFYFIFYLKHIYTG